jgi:NDP-sugar pyrophosphorylase family protein
MIFAAGMGTRLKPLTNTKPKALVEINKTPLLELVIKKLIKYGFDDIIINVHHFSGQIIEFLKSKNNFNISITISDESDLLLDTGGGLKKVAWFFNDNRPFLVYNVDILTDLNIKELYDYHCQQTNILATLAVKTRPTSRSLLINKVGQLCGWQNNQTGEVKISRKDEKELLPIAFSGIHVMNPSIFNHITEEGAFSITNVYLRLATHHNIMTYKKDDSIWMDMGRIKNIKEAENNHLFFEQ